MVMFLTQRLSLSFANGDGLDKTIVVEKKNMFRNWSFKAWCTSGESKPEISKTELNMETLGNKELKGVVFSWTWK